jgi:DNA-directed RNA polymerase subunit RPC12/RpoP
MNVNLLNIVNRIVAEQGEGILADARRLFPFFADYAKNEYKEERVAFGRCIEYGAYQVLKNTRSADERQRVKATLADQINAKTGVDRKRCADALDLLEAVIFKGEQQIFTSPSQAKLCSNCGKELQKEWTACPYCSMPVLNNVCSNCGKELQEGWTACPYCSTPAAKAGMQTNRQESSKPETPVIPNNTFSQTQQPVNLTIGCQGCLLNKNKCTYFDCAILEAEKYDCGMRGAAELQKKQRNSKIIQYFFKLGLYALYGWLVLAKIQILLGVNFWVPFVPGILIAYAIEHFIEQNIYKKRRENAKRL